MTTPFEKRIVTSLHQQVAHLDSETKQRLQAIRHHALNQPRKSWLTFMPANNWVSITGLIACSLMAVLLFLPESESINNSITLEQTAMFELLEKGEDLDTISDIGFYVWMDELEAKNV